MEYQTAWIELYSFRSFHILKLKPKAVFHLLKTAFRLIMSAPRNYCLSSFWTFVPFAVVIFV